VSDVVRLLEEILKNANSPLITIPTILIIVFFGYCAVKKFIDTGYIPATREARESLKTVDDTLRKEIERLNTRIKELEEETKRLRTSSIINSD
jgi:uncharacterized protein YlxW (UPF0749 family)